MKKAGKVISTTLFTAAAIGAAAWINYDNQNPITTEHDVFSKNIPTYFDGFRIAQVSDLHNTTFGGNNDILINMISAAVPNIITITGDLLDYYRLDLSCALDFVTKAVSIAPCYYTPGNHEAKIPAYKAFKERVKQLGVTVLEDETTVLETPEGNLNITGYSNIDFSKYRLPEGYIEKELSRLVKDNTGYTILLAHHPEYFNIYKNCNVDLVLSGHAHGGQVILPFVGGLYSPGQGTLPKYYSGMVNDNNTDMVISRGLGKSVIPFRVNNTPELNVITLHKLKLSENAETKEE